MEKLTCNRLLHAGFWSVLLGALGLLLVINNHETKENLTNESSQIENAISSINHSIGVNGKNDSNLHTRNLRNLATIRAADRSSPSIAWLMTFPNSGTTYTQKLIQQVTQTTTANVYGTSFILKSGEMLVEQQSSIPVYGDRLSGPFIFSEYDLPHSPSSYILTKTHCGGYCADCAPSRYNMNNVQFYQECRTGMKLEIDLETGEHFHEQKRHDPTLVQKAVHLFRNPLDNIAARYHHVWKHGQTSELEGIRENFSFDFDGFHAYCEYIDSKYENEFRKLFSEEVWEIARKVPCRTEFFKYVQWHNKAFHATKEILGIPTIVIEFEHFQHHLDVTTARLLRFLQLPKIKEPPNFVFNRYLFYTEEEKVNIFLFMKSIASTETWSNVQPYCNQERGDTKLCLAILNAK